MAKDPAILFYTSDFLSGTSFFTDTQRGQYIRLLCEQHQLGHIPDEHMFDICKTYDSPVWKKFTKDEKGFWFNERMEGEIIKRSNYCESRRKNKLSSKKEESYVHTYDKHMSIHMENGNENENINKKGKEGVGEKPKKRTKKEITEIIYPFDSEEFLKEWELWKKYKKEEHRFSFKSNISEQAALLDLSELSKQNEQSAIELIHHAIKKGWKGIFEINNNSNGNKQRTVKQPATTDAELAGIFGKHFATDYKG